VCGLLWPVGDDAGPGEVDSEKCRSCQGLRCTTVAGGEEGRGFSYHLESPMTYLAGSHILRSWPGIRLKVLSSGNFQLLTLVSIDNVDSTCIAVVPDRSIWAQQASLTQQCDYRKSKDAHVYSCCAVFCVVLAVMCDL
jgi:hypothetical protein